MPGSSDHLLHFCSSLLARAIAACRLDHDWEQPEQIAVTLRSLDLPQGRQLELRVSDTGAPIPDDLRVVKLMFSSILPAEAATLMEGPLTIRTTGLADSVIRVYHLQPAASSAAAAQPAASEQPVTPKQSRLAFSGSELSITLRPQANPGQVAACVQAALELTSMAAPKVLIKLRLKGFALQQHPDVSQATEPQGVPQAASTVLRYDNEPLPNTPDERFVAGLKTWFAEESVPTSSHLSQLGQAATCEANTSPGQQAPPTMLAIGQAGAAGHPDLLREHSNLQRCTWTAQVGVVLHSKVISPVLGYALPPGQAQLHLFQNHAVLQRPAVNIVKALQRFSWQEFGISAQVAYGALGRGVIEFAAASDALCQSITAIVIHLLSADGKQERLIGKRPALAPSSETKLIRLALSEALYGIKAHFPGSLPSKAELRLQTSTRYLAQSVAQIVQRGSTALQQDACLLLDTDLDSIQPALVHKLQVATEIVRGEE